MKTNLIHIFWNMPDIIQSAVTCLLNSLNFSISKQIASVLCNLRKIHNNFNTFWNPYFKQRKTMLKADCLQSGSYNIEEKTIKREKD